MPSDVDNGLDGDGDVAAGAWANTGALSTSKAATTVDLRMPIIESLQNVFTRRSSQRLASYSLCSRFEPSMIGCQPATSEIMNTSICRSSGALSFAVDL
jgi:hypothetical protein